MQIVCNETFEKLVKEYLASSGRVLVEEINEENMDKAFTGAKYFLSEVEVDLSSITKLDPKKETLGNPATFTTEDQKEKSEKTFTQIVRYTTGTELTETATSGWSITGGLSAKYQGIGASLDVGYSEQQSVTIKQTQGKDESQHMTDKFFVKPQCSRTAFVVRTVQRKERRAENVKLQFPKDAKLKCKFRKDKSNTNEKKFLVRDILDDYIENKGDDLLLTATLEGKCVWVETEIVVRVEPDKPLNTKNEQ